MGKLEQLAEIEGMEIDDLMRGAVMDGVCWGICTNPNCDYTTEVEPDQSHGFCEICKTQTVKSCAILAGII